ncbi:MAG: MMPL family transporter [Acidobacteriota bacterium]|nr:MMPL family transporter [Acidobacteriota bacterium]
MRRLTLLRWLAQLANNHYRVIFVAFGVAAVLAVVSASRIRFDTDVLNLLPQEDPVLSTFRETLEEFGSFENLLVGVRIPEGAPVDAYKDYAERLARELQQVDALTSVEYRIEQPQELVRQFLPGAVLFLDDAGRQQLGARLEEEGIRRRVQELRRQLGTPQALAAKDLLKLDPLGIASILLDEVESTRGNLQVDWTSGFYLSRDQRMLLILAKPAHRPQDLKKNRAMMAVIEERSQSVGEEWAEATGEPVPEMVYGGSYLTALDDDRFLQSDMIRNVTSSLLGVMLLFYIAFRRPSALLYAMLPLGTGLVLTFGFAGATVGALSHATSGVAALLIGLGIDFVIVSYGRYVEERRRGREPAEALAEMSGSSGRAVVVGALTTAATFGAFLLTDFPGLRQMGLLTGTGIVFCMLAVLLLLPALLAWSEHRHRRRRSVPNLYLHSFGTDRVVGLSLRHPRTVLALGLVITALTAWWVRGLEFEESMTTMRPQGNRGLEGAEEVAEHFGSGFDFTMLVLEAPTSEEALAFTARAAQGAEELVAGGELQGFRAVTSVIPPPERQRRSLDWLAEQRSRGIGGESVAATFRQAAAEEGIRAEAFEEGLELLARALERDRPITVEEIGESAQGQRLLGQYMRRTEDGWKSIVRVFPPDNRWRREPPPSVVGLAEELGPGAAVAGTNVVNQRVRQLVLRDAYIAGIAGFVLVAFLIFLDFRRVGFTVLSLTPLAVGILWMLGIMAAVGLDANFMNIFVSTMIIGIGVDYGLHMIHRYREIRRRADRNLEEGLQETAKAITAAALSTIVGFGSFSLSHYPGLRTTGYVAVLGALTTAVVAITVVPALLAVLERRK